PENGGLLFTFSDVDSRFTRTGGFGHYGAADAFCSHLAVHRILHVTRRDDLTDLDVGHFHAPALGDFIEAGAEHGVDVFALGEHIVQRDTTDHGAQGRRGDTGGGGFKVAHLQNRLGRVDQFEVPQE